MAETCALVDSCALVHSCTQQASDLQTLTVTVGRAAFLMCDTLVQSFMAMIFCVTETEKNAFVFVPLHRPSFTLLTLQDGTFP